MKSVSEISSLAALDKHAIFNRQSFDHLTLGDAALQRQLIESFLRQRAATQEGLLAAARAGCQEFGRAVHQLKGICHFTAAERLQHLVSAVEASTPMQHEADRRQIADALLDGLAQLEQALLEILAALKSPPAS